MLISLLLTALSFAYPTFPTSETVDNYHGTIVADPYRDLESPHLPQTEVWLKEQKALTQAYFDRLKGKEEIYDLLTQLYRYEKRFNPIHRGERHFYLASTPYDNQPKLYLSERGESRLLFDPNTRSSEGLIYIADFEPSLDGSRVCCLIGDSGSDWRTIEIFDTQNGKKVDAPIEWVKFSNVAWDKEGFYYARYPKPDSPLSDLSVGQSLYYHRIGTDTRVDQLVYSDPEHPKRNLSIQTDSHGDFLLLSLYSESDLENNALYIRKRGDTTFNTIAEGFDSVYQPIAVKDNSLYIRTNQGAPNYKIVAISLDNLEKRSDVIAEQKEILKESLLVGNQFLSLYEYGARHRLNVYDTEGRLRQELALPSIGQVESLSGEADGSLATFSFTSFSQPSTLYEWRAKEGTLSELFCPKTASFLDDMETEQLFYTSQDGTKVPLFLIYKRSCSGNAPLLLTGYGGFNYSYLPAYSPLLCAFIQRGGVAAVANIRGGGEYGEGWHKGGMLSHKQNCFEDFIAAAEFLAEKGGVDPKRMAAIGGSNGGLLVAASMIQKPDLFKAVIPCVGVLDMLRFQLFTIGWRWTTEYGSSSSAAQFPFLYRYSPLHNIRLGTSYPATLIMTGDHDDRVVPFHSYKFAAALQKSTSGSAPILLRIESSAGHGFGKPISKKIDENLDVLLFLNENLAQTAEEIEANRH